MVPYYFTDQKDMATEENRLKIEKTFFGTKEEALTNDQPYSVKSYYETSSFSQTVFEGDVIPWFPSKVGSSDQLKMEAMKQRKIFITAIPVNMKKKTMGFWEKTRILGNIMMAIMMG